MINLLPPEHKKKREIGSHLYALITVYIIVVALTGVGAAALATYNLTTGTTINEQQQTADQLAAKRRENQKQTQKAALIEDRLKQAGKYQESQQWDTVLDLIAAHTPTNVQLTSIKMSTDTNLAASFALNGLTTDRRAIILFREKLGSQPNFASASLQTIAEAKDDKGKKTFTFTIQAAYVPTAKANPSQPE